MKIKRNQEAFKPIVLTLETEEEFYAVLASIGITSGVKAQDFIRNSHLKEADSQKLSASLYSMYQELKKYVA